MNYSRLGPLDASPFLAASGAEGHRDLYPTALTFASKTIVRRCALATAVYIAGPAGSGRACACASMTAKRCWPAPYEQAVPTSRSLTGGSIPSDNDVLAFFEEKRKSLRAERKRAGRDVLLRAAMDQFGLSHKVVLDIWNNLPHDRKGGRPKKAKSVGFVRRTDKKAS
jgi:hypothetical protein